MIQKKICLLGAFSVGKTSLIQRYINSLFSDRYHTTVGVKVDKKMVDVDGQALMLMIWDIAGEDAFTSIKPAYLRGMSACIVVIDGTRRNSFDVALSVHEMVRQQLGEIPVVFALNKADLKGEWTLGEEQLRTLAQLGQPMLETSARLGQGVNEMFMALARRLC
ncbi:MAG: GTP-binding protein [Thiothrix sp.]|nr:GTP-binding protein [Thiothrix sp.]HPQ94845.1 Rab family GTPase [Thiolinea sp.]